ncbi:HEAT repeat domain-containing protein [Streptomyces sp. R21]|uniref:HEAT repeat domain-containing protein n=1 Tax=Streptomyces sp. R21 TaxID=3238627 RepID=A0AB39P1G0_9ACTN
MDSTMARLVGELDAESTEVAEEAQHALTALGPEVLDELIAAVPRFAPFGQLCAIEVFTALRDPRPGDVLIGLLDSESATVREWAAEALADLGIRRAGPAIQRAYDAFRRRGESPGYSEAVGLRDALSQLGAREVVIPPRAAALRVAVGPLDPAWPTFHLAEVIEDFAAHDQAVLYFQLWQVKNGSAFGAGGPGIDWDIDRRWSWHRIVADCRDWALLAADATARAPDLVATVCWIDASDL